MTRLRRMFRPLRIIAAIARFGVAESVAYRASMFVWILTTTFPLVSLVLWTSIAQTGPVGAFDRQGFANYFIAAFIVRQLTSSWVVWDLEREIRLGELAPLLLRPAHPLLHHAAINLAALPLRIALALPITLLVILATGGFHLGDQAWAWLLVPTSIVLAWSINFAGQVGVGCLAFWFTRAASLWEIWLGLYIVFSGYAVPTSLFPAWLATPVRMLPFHSTLGFPVEVLLGNLSGDELRTGFLLQVVWIAVFVGVATLAWTFGMRRHGAEGT